MKTKLSLLAVIIVLGLTSWMIPANSGKSISALSVETLKKEKRVNPEFESFKTHRRQHGVMANWSLTTTQNITGFTLQRTYEDPNDPYAEWENICAMPCGAGRSYGHHDQIVSPGFISYRVIAYYVSGGSMMSLICTEHIVQH